jgi:TfoX/Sxy family transcriptional regulator of competence genes
MAFDETVAARVREALNSIDGVTEKKMFGGLAFLLQGHMVCGVMRDELMVRVGPAAYDEALARPHARAMDFTGRPMRGMVFVAAAGFTTDTDLEAWVDLGVRHAATLPAKPG